MTISGKAMPKYSYMYGQVQVMLTWVQIWQCSEKLCQELVKLFKVMTEWYKVVPRYGKVWQNYSQICPSYQKLQQYIVKLYKQSHIKIWSDIRKPENVSRSRKNFYSQNISLQLQNYFLHLCLNHWNLSGQSLA